MKFSVITLFPEMFEPLTLGITGRALKQALISLELINPRDFTTDKHRTVDDRPYGGGPGMVMKPEPLAAAIESAVNAQRSATGVPAAEPGSMEHNTERETVSPGSATGTRVIYLSPQGKVFDQAMANSAAKQRDPGSQPNTASPGTAHFVLVCGRYEGIDQRIIDEYVDEEWSIGDYVLTGGELPAMVVIDAITRLLPGALGDEDSAEQDSFMNGLLDCPHYTRPEVFHGRGVPEILKSGDHKAISAWRAQESKEKTCTMRPDLIKRATQHNDD